MIPIKTRGGPLLHDIYRKSGCCSRAFHCWQVRYLFRSRRVNLNIEDMARDMPSGSTEVRMKQL